ncbi:uncharacterized protein LOC131255715 isoform X2 [Magnolia sinica]|uniref:uncharacterized protein LOC131255715 isoform X2 n=1 Tax=Magnolia sinica TaxID=86752 RepID=UPI00265B3146|nr:uncharacterized protein LOC131255715 isoform X2 [Magnolia sinica]
MVLGDYGGNNSLLTLWEALPFIAVVSGQNSAKSSILESIVSCTRQTKDRWSMLGFFTRQRGDFQETLKNILEIGYPRDDTGYENSPQSEYIDLP